LLRLWNTYSFFVIYANIDGFDPKWWAADSDTVFAPSLGFRSIGKRNELDRWILSELHRTCNSVIERMDAYDNFGACQQITDFVEALSNWYVRRSRDRFWAADKHAAEKLDAYWTLYECLTKTAKLIAPFTPFVAESIWQNLAAGRDQTEVAAVESVHLADYPVGNSTVIDEALSERMRLMRLISSLGRNARNAATLKVRQPLAKVEVILADTRHQAWLEEHADVIKEELNVKQLEFCDDPSLYVEHEVVPNFKLLGPKLGKLLPRVKQWLAQQTGAALLANIRDNGQIDLELDGQAIALTREEVEVRIRPRSGWTSANDQGCVVVLSTELTPELIDEGVSNDAIRLIQDRRKEIGCEYTDRIEVGLVTESADVRRAIERFREHIMKETLAESLRLEALAGVQSIDVNAAGENAKLFLRIVAQP
jgi:isoleucyl-tRNA synthetase